MFPKEPRRLLSEPTMTIISVNIEGLSTCKEEFLHKLIQTNKCDVLCIQETHRDSHHRRPKVPGMKLIAERPHAQYGSAIFAKPSLQVNTVSCTEENNIEVITIELTNCLITSVYKPPDTDFLFTPPTNFYRQKMSFVIGDFNSHSHVWGYERDDRNGEAVLAWAEAHELSLIHDSKLPPSFNSGRWKRGYNPDLLFVSGRMAQQCKKSVCSPIPKTQHRPIMCQVTPAVQPQCVRFRRRYNFKKANWQKFSKMLDERVQNVGPYPEEYEHFVDEVQICSRAAIPRGCRTNYIQGLTPETAARLNEYYNHFEMDPFGDETIALAESITASVSQTKKEQWIKMVEELDMGRSSEKAWRLLRRLINDPAKTSTHANVTADQIAHQLIKNGKPDVSNKAKKEKIERYTEKETKELSRPFTLIELENAITRCKSGKAAGLDEIRVEQIKRFGPATRKWLLEMINNCIKTCKIPKIWRRARVIAILKPGKDHHDPQNYRPISLLCHLFKVLERMILHRMMESIEPLLIRQQAGFRAGKSCTSQVLNLTQHIEDGFEKREITGAVFIDLSAAYDTVNHRLLLHKLYNLTKDYDLVCIIRSFLQNRRFYVEFQGSKSRWRLQRNGLPQGSVLAPTLFNVYTNDQPLPEGTQSFIYADDRAITVQTNSFEDAEERLSEALEKLSTYYKKNQLKPNPSKTQTCIFHLKNKQAARELHIQWQGTQLKHCATPKYLGVTLDRTLTYKKHCLNTRHKAAARNNIIRKLTSTAWGAQPQVIRTSAIALCYSAAEYACPVWYKSSHAKHVDVALNETCRLITGCLRPTPMEKVYCLAGIAPPNIRREVAAQKEKSKALTVETHPLYGHQPANSRLKSRKSFLHTTEILTESTKSTRETKWKLNSRDTVNWMVPSENLPPGHKEKWATWKSLNRLRSGVGRSRVNMQKWGFPCDSVLCECGEEQTISHLYECSQCPAKCTLEDLVTATPNALDVATYWSKII